MPEESKQQNWWQTLPGMLTAVGALLTAVTGLIVALRHDEQAKVTSTQATTLPAATQQAPPNSVPPPMSNQASPVPSEAPLTPNIGGMWRDNWGTVSQVTQDGSAYQFTAEGISCTGAYVQSSGSGSIAGNSVHSTYRSSIPSRGSCSGTLSANGNQLTSTCTDSVCGTFVSSSVRQR